MKRWYKPSFGGDLRLTAIPDSTTLEHNGRACLLEVNAPTPGELVAVARLLREAREKGWLDQYSGLDMQNHGEIRLECSIDLAGPLLLGRPVGRPSLTVVKLTKSEEVLSFSNAGLAAPEGVPASEPTPDELAAGEAAVTVVKPTTGRGRGDCPESLASEVLHDFCSAEQWACWQAHGYLVARGHATGRRYRLAHRKLEAARRQGCCAFAVDDGMPVAAYDFMVPPPEEVLMFKLLAEHRESWLRNSSTMEGARELFVDPHPWLRYADWESDRMVGHLDTALRQNAELYGKAMAGLWRSHG